MSADEWLLMAHLGVWTLVLSFIASMGVLAAHAAVYFLVTWKRR